MAGKSAQAGHTGVREVRGRFLRAWRHAEQVRVLACLLAPVLLTAFIGCGVQGPECAVDADCDDGVACTADTCVSAIGVCASFEIAARCDDGFFCNGDEICNPDSDEADEDGCLFTADPCGGTTPVCDETVDRCLSCSDAADCSDGIPCTDDSCEPDGSCANPVNESNCPDPDFCDGIDACDPTNEDSDADGCVAPGNPCDELTPICDEEADQCIPCISNTVCDDGFPCTDDLCQADGSCSNTPNNGKCADPLFCDGIDICDPTSEEADAEGCHAPGDPCPELTPICHEEDDTCRPCISDEECGDGNPCTDDICIEDTGACNYPPTDCDDGEECTADSCDSVTGECENAAIADCCTTDDECDDGAICTSDVCADGQCQNHSIDGCCHTDEDCPGTQFCSVENLCTSPPPQVCVVDADCDDDNICTDDACEGGVCVFSPNADACDDGDDCTDMDTCAGGACVGMPINCDDDDVCTIDDCMNGDCIHDKKPPPCDSNCGLIGTDCAQYCQACFTCDGDVTCDGVVDQEDFDAVLALCGMNACGDATCKFDVNCDKFIDEEDSAYVQARFGTCEFQTFCGTCLPREACCRPQGCVNLDPDSCDALPDGSESQGVGTRCCVGSACLDCGKGDTCFDDACEETEVDCDDADACTDDSCVDDVCVNEEIDGCCDEDADCDDLDACTTDGCVDDACEYEEMDCDDGDVCTDDSCVDGVCVNAEIEGCCDTPALCDGDVNGDGVVDSIDIGAILAHFGLDPCEKGNCQYDADCDGVIGSLDTGYVLARLGTCDPVPACEQQCTVENDD